MELEAEKLGAPRKPAKKKSALREKSEYWFVRVLVVLIPAYFSYRTAKVEAEAKAAKEAKEVRQTAAAGYDELARAVIYLSNEIRDQRSRMTLLEESCGVKTTVDKPAPMSSPPRSSSVLPLWVNPPDEMAKPAAPAYEPDAFTANVGEGEEALDLAPSLDKAAQKRGL